MDFTAAALKQISPEIIKRSFECCGIGEKGEKIPLCKLNTRLQAILDTRQITPSTSDHPNSSNLVLEEEEGDENFDEESEMVLQEELSMADGFLSVSENLTDSSKCETDEELV